MDLGWNQIYPSFNLFYSNTNGSKRMHLPIFLMYAFLIPVSYAWPVTKEGGIKFLSYLAHLFHKIIHTLYIFAIFQVLYSWVWAQYCYYFANKHNTIIYSFTVNNNNNNNSLISVNIILKWRHNKGRNLTTMDVDSIVEKHLKTITSKIKRPKKSSKFKEEI